MTTFLVDWILLPIKYSKGIKSNYQYLLHAYNTFDEALKYIRLFESSEDLEYFLLPIMTETIATVPRKRFGSIQFLISFLFGAWMWRLELSNMTTFACGGVCGIGKKNSEIGFF